VGAHRGPDRPGEGGFTRPQANALIAAARAHPLGGDEGTTILRDHFRHLTVGQMVGVIAAPGCSLEIFPKIDQLDTASSEGRRTVRERLVRMLDVALGLDIGMVPHPRWRGRRRDFSIF
jgi:5-methylcytosine-specific restriction enzyme subunit McrC